MPSFNKTKFIKNNNENMFKEILEKMYPELSYNSESGEYFDGDISKGNTESQLISNLSNDLSQTKLPSKLNNYPDYLAKVSKRNKRNDKTLKSFSYIIAELSGCCDVNITKTTTDKIITTTDKNLIEMRGVKYGVLLGKVQPVYIEEIIIIPERVTVTNTKETIWAMNINNSGTDTLGKGSGNISLTSEDLSLDVNGNPEEGFRSSHPLAEKYPNVAKRGDKLNDFMLDKLHSYLENDIIECEETHFSYSKCQKYLVSQFSKWRTPLKEAVKITKTIRRIIEEEEGCLLTNVYEFLSDSVDNLESDGDASPFTYNEKVYVQFKLLSGKLQNYFSARMLRHSGNEDLEQCEDEIYKLADLCMLQEVPLKDFPVDITLC